jgi:hypothetical protein
MIKSTVIFTYVAPGDSEFITVYAPGRDPLPADNTHANFDTIKALCLAAAGGAKVDPNEVVDLFDIAETVERQFQRLTERVAVQSGVITLDGDPVDGSLQDQILDFLRAGEDFGPLVNFYEKLATNPLGDVREGLFDWIVGQRKSGPLTITPDGDVIGYKAVRLKASEWRRTDGGDVYTPSRRGIGTVNGVDVKADQYIEQLDGDVVEMPRSKVLHEPSRECADGLHIGNYEYASTFLSGDNNVVLLVKFSPRDIVSLPDSNSSWKLRVCRYTVIGTCDEPYPLPLYLTESATAAAEAQADEQGYEEPEGLDLDLSSSQFAPGDRVVDEDGDVATVLAVSALAPRQALVSYDCPDYDDYYADVDDLRDATRTQSDASERAHGKGGPTSLAARGNGRNPNQDALGRFAAGRPGSARDVKTGRFA